MNKKKTKPYKNKRRENESRFIKLPSEVKKIDMHDIINGNYPIFCFKYLSEKSIKGCTDYEFYHDFLMRLKKLSILGWDEIKRSPHHSFGMEPIPINKIKPLLPPCITPDITKLHVFRATGNNLPFIGIQIQNIFRILFIETQFGDIYDHH